MSRVGILQVTLALATWTGLSAFAVADDWMVDRLRGEVLVMIEDSWLPLQRGDIVSDSSRIRSVEGSRVTFTRGAEAIELSGATEIRIFDQQGERMTTIMQAYGTVTVEAERLQIQHFSVQTPFLAAIVKGTRFTVHSDDSQSSVDVSRGLVQVQDYTHGVATDIAPGQTAVVSNEIMLDVSGGGRHAPMVTLEGDVLPPVDGPFAADQGNNPGNGNAFGLSHSHDNNGKSAEHDHNNGNGNAVGDDHDNGNSGNGNGGSSDNKSSNGQSNGNSGNGNSGNGNNGNHGDGNNGNGGSADNKSSNGQGNGNSGNGNSGNGNNGELVATLTGTLTTTVSTATGALGLLR